MTTSLIQREPGHEIVVTDAGLEQIERLAAEGVADTTIARTLSVSIKAFRRIVERDERVDTALQTGRARMADELTDILMTHAREGSITAAIYLSKAKLGWRDQGPAPQTINPTQINISVPAPMSEAEFKKLITVNKEADDPQD